MKCITGIALFLAAMVTNIGAVPVTTDADTADTDNFVAAGNLQPSCRDSQTFRICTALNTHPHCSGATFINDLGDQCARPACWCE
ncbi:hypothetical protein CONLIGDRAFT_681577 [Coniochaeta ligniaria NRRL 30616]|uniref:Chitin-binding type-2 domain-containing protein n=1 Tax=Coniochaeta ligniaria NRRL 30616 TaxID=1408157 RepID=A0A1J7IM26_9PEZI|nr:hypothetical protein CONLIGDRAFT_681577 [Coniochaeta ligniaria NRRL 30616]